jgi:histidinol dehydrogenase
MHLVEIIRKDDFKSSERAKQVSDSETRQCVSDIIGNVLKKGDLSISEYTRQFDKIEVPHIKVPEEKILAAENQIDPDTKLIFETAIANIKAFHKHQIQTEWAEIDKDGTRLGELVRPLDRVGIYVPGGRAFYPSSMIMNAIPALLAGVASIAVASPPDNSGFPHQLVLGICGMLGIKEVYAMGGAQAVAALAYGTETIRPVCKITGPGNKYVAEAKRQVYGKVGIDSIAGPSEILILHDVPEIPIEYIVRDLISQAEHDEDAQSILVTTIPQTAEAVQKRLDELVPTLPRKEIIEKSLRNHGKIILVGNLDDGIEISNQIAPEHLELLLIDESKIDCINNAGAIFIGRWSSEAVGDYMAGPNHTIPTSGAARFASPLSVRDFQKHSSIIHYSKKRLINQGKQIAQFAELENLFGHAAAITERLK